MISWIKYTAWPMMAPMPYGTFHIIITLVGVLTACFLAWKLRTCQSRKFYNILFFCGSMFAVSELYKQFFLYEVVTGNTYDWWYFPFQLCSLPMYLCLLLPWIRSEPFKKVVCTFLQDFGLLGGIMALLEPSGLMHPYWTLTLHGFLWHFMLIFIGLFIGFSGRGERGLRGYLKTMPLLAVSCMIATAINLLTQGAADMFYISPYHPVMQVFYYQFSLRYGITAGIMIYLASICIGGMICHMAMDSIKHKGVTS